MKQYQINKLLKLGRCAERLVNLIEGPCCVEWRNHQGFRLKDTKEWVEFYVASRKLDFLGPEVASPCNHDIGRIQILEQIAEAALSLEVFLGKNAGTTADYPLDIKCDNETTSVELSSRLNDLTSKLAALQKEKD